jgi:hypothetical protein
LSQSPSPGWYADPQGVSVYRWWDGLAWTAHTAAGQPANPLPQQGFYGGPMSTSAAQATQFRPAPTVTSGQRNQYAFITLGIVALVRLDRLESPRLRAGRTARHDEHSQQVA